jgi:hypothetical protein
MRTAVLLPLVAALVGCGSAKAPTTGELAAPTQQQQAALMAANNFRDEAGLAPMTFKQALQVAAVRHAGYQAIEFNGAIQLTHDETDTGNALYTAQFFADRIRKANNNQDIYPSSVGHVYYEGITSVGMPYAIASLWNTVYHRLPLCRHHSKLFGYGEEDTAGEQYPGAHVPDTSKGGAGPGYATTEYAGPGNVTVTPSFWPPDNWVTLTEFSTDSESPDPISSLNSGQVPGTPDQDVVGPPIHAIIPTSQRWTSITMELATQAAPATLLDVYVLVGYAHGDPDHFEDITANPPPTDANPPHNPLTIAMNAPVVGWTWDVELDEGEVFILPVAPLIASTKYQYRLQATAGTDSIDTGLIHFTAK